MGRSRRVVAETVDGRRVESRYDCCGNRVERVGLGGRVESRYDPLGALTALEIAGHGALTLEHDAAGRELRRASAAGFVLESSWTRRASWCGRSAGGGGVPARVPGRCWSGSMAGTGRTHRCRCPTCAGAGRGTGTTATGRWWRGGHPAIGLKLTESKGSQRR